METTVTQSHTKLHSGYYISFIYTYPACGKSFWVSPKCPRICPRLSPQGPSEFLEEDDRVRSLWFGWASCEEASDGLDTTWALPNCPVASPWTRAQTARLRFSKWQDKGDCGLLGYDINSRYNLKIEAVCFIETPKTTYQTVWYNTEIHNLNF